jgi:hypothetical protein
VPRAQHQTSVKRAGAALALMALVWGGVAWIDTAIAAVQHEVEESAPPRPAPARAAGSEPAARPPGRVFVLLVDSLRAETALGLPALRALRPGALLVHVLSTQDAATVPSLRAAFTGKTQRSIFAFTRNFFRGGGTLPSIFTQLSEAGGRSATYSDGVFYELASGITSRRSNAVGAGDEEAQQGRAFADALALYRSGAYQIVVFHLTTVDHAAHIDGVGGPLYQRTFVDVDDMIRRADAAVPPDETLVVMGDHGHDPAGRHFPGLAVPTIAAYRGPRFRAGAEVGPLPLTIHRYLLSWALGLPLSDEYAGPGAPEALASPGPLPAAFVAPRSEIPSEQMWLPRMLWMLPLVVAVAMLAWLALARAGLVELPHGVTFTTTLVVALGLAMWGALLARRPLVLAPPTWPQIRGAWLAAGAVAGVAVATGLARRTTAAWALLAVPGLLLHPSATRDGWAAVMGPAWLAAVLLLAVDWTRRRVLAGDGLRRLAAEEWAGLGALALVALGLLRFFYAESQSFVFTGWRGFLTSERLPYWIVAGTIARLVIFLRPSRGVVHVAVGLALVSVLSLISFGDGVGQEPCLTLAALLGATALATRTSARPLSAMLTNAALLVAYRATVVLDERTFLELEVLLAALRLTALATARLAPADEGRSSAVWLQAMALIVAAWGTLALTLHRLEWHVLYRLFPPAFVALHAGLFGPIIVARYALPLVIARRLLGETRALDGTGAWRAGWGALGLKLGTLVLIVAGYAVLDPTGEPYLMAVQNLLSLSPLVLAFVA